MSAMISSRYVIGMKIAVVAASLALAGSLAFAAGPRPPEQQANGPFVNIKVSPVKVTWQYSNDGGKTFVDKPFAGPPRQSKPHHKDVSYPYAWKGEFEIADPAKVGGVWVRIFDDPGEGKFSSASICNGDIGVAGCGYWKNLGYCPAVLDASVTLNGKEVKLANGPLLQFWVPLADVQKGKNTVEVRGNVYTYHEGQPAKSLEARVIMAEPQPTEIYGPVVGDSGDGYFTLTFRTQLPADASVEATPAEPAGQAVTVASTDKLWHRMKIEVPKGTRQVSYTLTAKVGSHITKRGPLTLTLRPTDKEYRFVAYGCAYQHADGEPWGKNSRQILKAQPAFVVNTGNPVEMGCWLFAWQSGYIGAAAEMLSSVPNLATPADLDAVGMFNEIHYTPAADGYSHNWTKVMGPARFIGIDSNLEWAPGNANYKWLEGILSASKDKFIVVLCGHPGYSSGHNSKKLYGQLGPVRNVIMPLLGKYNATVMLSSYDTDYERIEPTPDKGIVQIITGAIGFKTWHSWSTTMGGHPFGPTGPAKGVNQLTGGREWCGILSRHHFCIFDVKENAIEMKVVGCGAADADIKDLEVLDKKTFKPRQ